MRDKIPQVSIAIVCLVLGIMLALQFKATETYEASFLPSRLEELTQKLNVLTEERDTLAEETASLREKLSNVRETDEAMADLQEELHKANLAAGLVALKGPGVIITLNDSTRALQPGENPNALLVHERDIIMVINELKASGAEAISINDERIIAMSEVRCAGTMILVNWNKIGPPFTIKAIGNPDMLESGVLIKGGYFETLKYLGLQTSIQKEEEIEIPAFSRTIKFSFGQPVQYTETKEEK
jgi:uncharacterized protein YlxW (UPF0749 family)